MKNYRDTHTDTEYQHFVDEISFRPVKSSDDSNIFYDKKYFDYLPEDENVKQGDEVPQQRENHRRLKRQTVDCKDFFFIIFTNFLCFFYIFFAELRGVWVPLFKLTKNNF